MKQEMLLARGKKPCIHSLWAVATAALVLVSAAAAQTEPQSARQLTLTVGKSLVVNSASNIERIAVGFGDFAEARATGPREVLLDGKTPGETSLIIWQTGGNMLYFDVLVKPNTSAFTSRLDDLKRQLQQELPDQPITVSMQGDSVFLRGTAKNLLSAERAITIASTAGKVVNLLYVELPPTDAQILLKVQFATIDRSVETDLGMNLFSTGATNTVGSVSTGQFTPPTVAPTGGAAAMTLNQALNIFMFRPGLNLGTTIKALETRGLAEILAEPNVLAINGKQASFLSGGEFPYPILQGGGAGLGTVTVAFREFGVRINFLPVITPRGTIRLDVAPEVSALDFTAGLTISGFTIPALTSRKIQTEIELETGQSFAIGGLLDRRLTETLEKIPLLANIPLLGKLFQSRTLTKQNNELLVIITPELVKPTQTIPGLTYPLALAGPTATPANTPAPGSAGSAPVATERLPMEELLRRMKIESDMKLQQGADMSTWPNSSSSSTSGAPGGGNPIKQ